MSEDLDFEADISSNFNVETPNVAEVDTPNENAIQFDPGEVEDDTIEIHSNIREVLNDAGEIQSNCEEVENDTIEIQSNNRDVEFDINIIQFNAGESHSDACEMQSDAGEMQSDAGEMQSDAGEMQSDAGEMQSDAGEIQSDAGEIQSDAGEIQSDAGEIENSENLEEGEIKDNAPIPNKNPEETVCWFFKRGNCLYGSECRNLHVSNKVYNMFEPVLSNRSNVNSLQLQNAHVPPAFHPPMLIMSNIETPWERGIKRAKIVMENSNFRKSNQEDIENDWKRCLEVAKQSIQQKTNLRRKSCDSIKPYFDSKYCEQGRFLEREPEDKLLKSKQSKSHIFSYSKYKKESNCEKKTKSDVTQTPDHLKWVDPWQRSKSPRKRTKSFSLSPSPSMKRSRKGSISSSSSSSSCFERIYGRAPQSKSPKRFRSASRSSVFPSSKKSRTLKERSHSRGRSYSRSPRRSYCSGSCSSSRTSSVSSEDLYAHKKSNAKTTPASNLASKKEKRCLPAENSKDVHRSSFVKRSLNKTSDRASSPCHSDKSTSSNLSMSSLSYTSFSSNGKGTLQTNYAKAKKSNAISRSNIDKVPRDRSKDASKPEQGNQKSNALKNLSTVSDQKRVLSPDKKKLLIYKDTSTKAKCVETANLQVSSLNKPVSIVSKPSATKNVTTQKSSNAALELLKYHSFARKNKIASVSTPAVQSKTILPVPTEAASSAASKIPCCQEKAGEEALPKITSNMILKPQKPINSNVLLKMKEAGSKRKLLLQQLQAIEDAIARKKQPLQ